jgi:hypothetical protein
MRYKPKSIAALQPSRVHNYPPRSAVPSRADADVADLDAGQ